MVSLTFRRKELAMVSNYNLIDMIFSLADDVKKKREAGDAGAGEGTSAYRTRRTWER